MVSTLISRQQSPRKPKPSPPKGRPRRNVGKTWRPNVLASMTCILPDPCPKVCGVGNVVLLHAEDMFDMGDF